MNDRKKFVAIWFFKVLRDENQGMWPDDVRTEGLFPSDVTPEEIDDAQAELLDRGLIYSSEQGELSLSLEGLRWNGVFSKRPHRTGKGTVCSFEGCDKPVQAKRLCQSHYGQKRRGLKLRPLRARWEKTAIHPCRIEGCRRKTSKEGGLCQYHTARERLTGSPTGKRTLRESGMSEEEHAAWILSQCAPDGSGCMIWPHGTTGSGYAASNRDGNCVLARYIVADHELPPRPEGAKLHNSCGNKLCLSPEHLRWATQSEICTERSTRRGRGPFLKEEQIVEMRERRAKRVDVHTLARDYGITAGAVYNICAGKVWSKVGGPRIKPFSMKKVYVNKGKSSKRKPSPQK